MKRLFEIISLDKFYTHNALVESCPLINEASSYIWTSEVKRLDFPRIEGEIYFLSFHLNLFTKLLLFSFTAEMVGESEYGSDGWIVRSTQISPKCWKVTTLFSVCICGLYRWSFDTILRWSTFVHILFVQVFRFSTRVMLFFGFTMKPPTISKRTISLNNCSRLQWDALEAWRHSDIRH